MTTAGHVTDTTDARSAFLDDYRRLHADLAGADRPWLATLRQQAIDRFAEIGFPAVKNEDWKYTSVTPILRQRFEPSVRLPMRSVDKALAAALSRAPGLQADDLVTVFVNGHCLESFQGRHATAAVEISNLSRVLAADGNALAKRLAAGLAPGAHGFLALNTAFAADGAYVHVKKPLEHPIHVVHLSLREASPYVTHPRNVIVVESGASASIVEHWLGEDDAGYLTNAVTDVFLGRDASLQHVKVQQETDAAYHVQRVEVRQERGSVYRSHSVALGAALSRTEIRAELAGEGADCALYGLYVGSGHRHIDHHTTIDHACPRTSSRELYKGILDDHARGVFTGRVIVRPDAQQISAEQTNRNLLLAPGAVVETRPQLEIYADDVKCSHGAAIGRLDEDALFYMRQRGIDREQARSLLTYAFGSEVLDKLGSDVLRRALEKCVLLRIHKDGDGLNEEELEGVIA
jgi:Fe-S cluster assembly protein SufD